MASPVATAGPTTVAAAITTTVSVLGKSSISEADGISCHRGNGEDKTKACGSDHRADVHEQVLHKIGHRRS
ncbi:exported hypothetical protein [Agrobacterium deltaense Zutra 3/1]|uniref:Uncharacterized protein n=1 Tax=Agrobacterium deltaense Zutra 3/1 TaxID=1183427 RepID=A0A1S7S1N0_9HYPH|nr:exported hypothetical protein [Agrobacterium deltaense Zutra 3/1]